MQSLVVSSGCEHAQTGVDSTSWRRAMGSFPSGVIVLTTQNQGRPSGTTVSAFSSVSLAPPLLLACLDRGSRTLAAVRSSGVFAVNILAEQHAALALKFAARGADDRFSPEDWEEGWTRSPLLKGAAAIVECSVHELVDAGDHVLVIGAGLVVKIDEAATPLVYRSGRLDWRMTAAA